MDSKQIKRALTVGAGIASVLGFLKAGSESYLYFVAPLTKYDVTGAWCVSDEILESNSKEYVGKTAVFHLILKQKYAIISGSGGKTGAIGIDLPPIQRSALTIDDGLIEGTRVKIEFHEQNDAAPGRHLQGHFDWEIVSKNLMIGTFSSSAASSSGKSKAERC